MGALAPPRSLWAPEDDILLRKAIQDGASLESLAKGAVKFSTKFTVEELKERWRSVLFDPVKSVEAALGMVEFDHLVPSLFPKQKRLKNDGESNGYAIKRKIQSVRSRYYTSKKRRLNESSNCIDMNLFAAPVEMDYEDYRHVAPGFHDISYPDPCHFESDLDILGDDFDQLVDDINDFSQQFEDYTQELIKIEQNDVSKDPCNGIIDFHQSNNVEGETETHEIKDIAPLCTTSVLANNSPAPNFLCSESDDLALWSAPRDEVNLSSETNVHADSSDVFMTELHQLSSTLLNFTNDEELLLLDKQNGAISTDDLEALLFSSNDASQEGRADCSTMSNIPKQSDEFLVCVLNTEDTEIPCNDDVVFTTEKQNAKISSSLKMVAGRHNRDGLAVPYETGGTLKRRADELTSTFLQVDTSEMYPGLKLERNDCGDLCDEETALRTNTHFLTMVEEETIESDDDVPQYSDVEAMVLDMDLDPNDHHIFSNKGALLHHLESTKKLIIRLEQAAHSSMRRSIASHGAFAILYGRISKHYIKKSEVTLGRRTEDVKVDIDLGMEASSHKISRRQAVINLLENGTFRLKNLGKRRIWVNDKQISSGESVSLPFSCLIEVRGVPFIFETYQKLVHQFFDKRTQQTIPTIPRLKHVKLR